MPRTSSGPRLWFDKTREKWTIVDGKKNVRTGCPKADSTGAQEALREYLGRNHVVEANETPLVADMLLVYLKEHVPTIADKENTAIRIGTLEEWWGDMVATDITNLNCQAYARHRAEVNVKKAIEAEVKAARLQGRPPEIEQVKSRTENAGMPGARRDLEILRAATNYWNKSAKHGPLKFMPVFWLPPKPEAREQWLTRKQQAKMLWAARRVPHLGRFLILSWYTGSRSGVLFALKWNMINLDGGIMRRKPHGAVQTKKRAPPIRIGKRLSFWLPFWKRHDGNGATYVIHYKGGRITKLRRSFETAREAAGLPEDVTPHTMRHSRATHLMRQKIDPVDAAAFLGMTVEQYLRTYGHHHPDWQKDAADAR